MGNFEKLVVLTVLFLSAIVLAVSFSPDGEEDLGMNPLMAANRATDGGASEEGAGGRLTLNTEGELSSETPNPVDTPEQPGPVTAQQEPRPVQTNDLGHPRVLKTREGLIPSPLKGYMLYTLVEGDTWSGLSDRFYGGGTFVDLLRSANEDLEGPTAGSKLLIPVYDFRAAPPGHEPREAGPVRAAEAPSAVAQTYVVVDGDSLWRIADKIYGSGARWMEIYQANRDVMDEPDSLTLGMSLRIP